MNSDSKIDVFLSRKSEDAHLAKEIYDFLTSKGLKVFDSDITLGEIGNAEYNRVIDKVLEKTTHFILVCSSIEYINTTYVYYEWDMFNYRKKIGDAHGNLIVIITKDIIINQLPLALRRNQIIVFDDFKNQLINFVPLANKENEVDKLLIAEINDIPNKELKSQTVFQSINLSDSLYEKGRKLRNEKKYKEAIPYLLQASNLGNADAQCMLGGIVASDNIQQAIDLYTKAANQGHAAAHMFLGELYRSRINDYSKAEFWFEKASKMKNAFLFNGEIYADHAMAIADYFRWRSSKSFWSKNKKFNLSQCFDMTAADELNNAMAQYRLGRDYAEGRMVKKDDEKAKYWFIRAAKQGDKSSIEYLNKTYGITDY